MLKGFFFFLKDYISCKEGIDLDIEMVSHNHISIVK